jgi:hypothetical protein
MERHHHPLQKHRESQDLLNLLANQQTSHLHLHLHKLLIHQ